MALWPFRRKSRRRRSRDSLADLESARGRITEPVRMSRRQTLPDMVGIEYVAPQMGLKKERSETSKLQRRPRTYSFSPGRHDSVRLGRGRSMRARRGPAPMSRVTTGTNPVAQAHYHGTYDEEREMADNAAQALVSAPVADHRAPTLHNKREGDHLPRKKSSKKRRKEENIREAEIKAMSSFIPLRPATEDCTAGRPMKKDTRRVRTGFGLGFRGAAGYHWDRENRSSEISLPPAESTHSSLSSDSEHITFKISALEVLTPRPTLHYAVNPRGPSDGSRKLSSPISEATLKAHKRICELADDLSAGDLRELMERDQRRRERKKQRDHEKMERRLVRRAEKQKAEEEAALREGRESPPNLERGVLGREAIGLGIGPASAVVTSSKRRSSESTAGIQSRKQLETGRDEQIDDDDDDDDNMHRQPLDVFHRTTSIVADPFLPTDEPPGPVPPSAPSHSSSPKSRSIFRRLSWSKSPQVSEAKAEASETSRKASESSSSRVPISWTSIFRWGSKNKRNSAGPSSFSNTSRDSMLTTQLPTPPPSFVPRKTSSGMPKRTMSRFREDLPELPSPPASHAKARESEQLPPTIVEATLDRARDVTGMTFAPAAQGPRHDTPTSGHRSIEALRRTPSSFSCHDELGQQTSPGVSPEPQSISLASIDSEGSWLSGRVRRKRHSSGILETSYRSGYLHRESGSENSNPNDRTTNEEPSAADDENSGQHVHHDNADRPEWSRRSTGEALPASQAVNEDARWGSVSGHQPTVIHSASHMRSHEVLLNPFEEEGDAADTEPTGCAGDQNDDEGIQRAKSVNLSTAHVRHISAGSARLLSITPRSSVDMKCRSPEPKSSEGRL